MPLNFDTPVFSAKDMRAAYLRGFEQRMVGTPFEAGEREADRYAEAILSVARQADSRAAPVPAETATD